jgi:hypothetical protein
VTVGQEARLSSLHASPTEDTQTTCHASTRTWSAPLWERPAGPSNRKQLEALSAISDIVVQISDEDLARLESLAQQITQFDRELGDHMLEAHTPLTQLHDDVEVALERLEPQSEDLEEEEDIEAAEAEVNETQIGDQGGKSPQKRRSRSKRKE